MISVLRVMCSLILIILQSDHIWLAPRKEPQSAWEKSAEDIRTSVLPNTNDLGRNYCVRVKIRRPLAITQIASCHCGNSFVNLFTTKNIQGIGIHILLPMALMMIGTSSHAKNDSRLILHTQFAALHFIRKMVKTSGLDVLMFIWAANKVLYLKELGRSKHYKLQLQYSISSCIFPIYVSSYPLSLEKGRKVCGGMESSLMNF